MNHCSAGGKVDLADGSIASSVGIDQSIAFELGQPDPTEAVNGFQVGQTAVPTVKQDTLRFKTSGFSQRQHGLKMIILAQPVIFFVIHPVMTGNMAFAIAPHQVDQVDPGHDPMMFAGPVPTDQLNLLGIVFVQGGVVQHQDPLLAVHLLLGLSPQRGTVQL
jgi:hypothetical protein